MNNLEKKYELIKFKDGEFSLDVTVSPEEETVWLNAQEIADMFERDYKTISKHINNVFLEKELEKSSNSQKMRLIGNNKPTIYYNLNVIISVGYRVKSIRGVKFRQWATSILKQYLLHGYAINNERIIAHQSNILKLESDVCDIRNRLSNLENTIYSDNSKIIFEGEILEPYTFIRKLFFLANNEITIIDQYADKFLLSMLTDLKVKITIVTSPSTYLNKEIIPNNITIIHTNIIHDRYIIIDEQTYIIGTSFNDIGKKRFFIIKSKDIKKDTLLKNIN